MLFLLSRLAGRVVAHGTRLLGRASKSAFAAVSISSLVIERIGASVKGRWPLSSNTSTIDPLVMINEPPERRRDALNMSLPVLFFMSKITATKGYRINQKFSFEHFRTTNL